MLNKITTGAAGAAIGLLVLVTSAFAATSYSFFGDAEYTQPGRNSIRAVETTSTSSTVGGIDFEIEEGTTFADLESLSTDYMVTAGACGGGSPRFQINVIDENGDEQNIFVYLGEEPNYTCTTGVWLSSGDQLETGQFVDTSQLGGTFYHEYSDALLQFGELEVTGVQLVTDAGWMFGTQTVQFDNTVIDLTLFDYEPTREEGKQMCKNGGWQDFDGTGGMPGPFKNQGQCVAFFASNGRSAH